ncbi:MAG TPA: two-component sensor histidine kinase [Pseudohongiella sp.]|nr:two-component sensor histidine kinase [Pseudohongiella sp.]
MQIPGSVKNLYTLRLALLAGVLIPVVLVVALAGSWSLRLLEDQVNQRMQQDIELIAHAIRLPLSHALERDRIGSINQALNSAFTIDVVYGAYVYDENGEEVARSGRRAARVATDQAASLAASGDQLGEFSQAGNEEIFSYFVPLTDAGGRINGLLQLTRRGSDFSNYIAMVRATAWFALAGLCLLLAIIVIGGHHYALGRPLRRMLEGIKQIRSKDSQARLAIEGPAEVRNISGSINNMLDRIESSEKLATIGRLSAGIAHELGSPLAALDGKAQQALRETDSESRTGRCLTQIRSQAQRMEVIIRQLLDYGRDNPLQRVSLEISQLVEQATDHALAAAPSARDSLCDGQPTIKVEGSPLRVRVDAMRFDQALSNLIGNALHACQSQIRISWDVVDTSGSQSTRIMIEDDGDGISKAELPNLFDPFFTTKPVGQGTGLGLAVAHAAVADHGGHISVARSERLGGACFTIHLPASAPQA